MAAITFDTLKFANQLKIAGVPSVPKQKPKLRPQQRFETNLSEFATKEDLHREISDFCKDMDARSAGVDAKLEKTELALQQKMSDLKFELLKSLIGLAVAQADLIIGPLKLLPISS